MPQQLSSRLSTTTTTTVVPTLPPLLQPLPVAQQFKCPEDLRGQSNRGHPWYGRRTVVRRGREGEPGERAEEALAYVVFVP